MTWEEREALIKEAAVRLKWALETDREPPLLPWRRREWLEARGRAIEAYLVDVHAAYFAESTQYGAPSEEESKRVFAEAFNRALNEVPHPEVAARAEELKAHLEDFWAAQYWRARAEKGIAAPLPAEIPTERTDEAWLRWREERLRIARGWRQKLQAEAAAVNQDTAAPTDPPPTHAEAPQGLEARIAQEGPGMSEAAPTQEPVVEARTVDQSPAAAPQASAAEEPGTREAEVKRRKALLDDYIKKTGTSKTRIWKCAGQPNTHSGHKAEFVAWLRGELPAESATAQSLERFLRRGEPPPE
jgi:hypothetical protein